MFTFRNLQATKCPTRTRSDVHSCTGTAYYGESYCFRPTSILTTLLCKIILTTLFRKIILAHKA
jgi:hypothetical protein